MLPIEMFAGPLARKCDPCKRRDQEAAGQRSCKTCGEVKPRRAFRHKAQKCRRCQGQRVPSRQPVPRACARCGQVKPPEQFVRGGRNCRGCRRKPPPSASTYAPRACHHCLEVKPPEAFAWGRGERVKYGEPRFRRRRSICRKCERQEARSHQEQERARRATWEEDGVLVRRCSICADVKPLEEGFYIARRNPTVQRSYHCKTCSVKRTTEVNRRRRQSDPEFVARRNAWTREWRRKNPERNRESQRRARERMMADPVKRQRRLENQRIAYRLRQEARGRSLDSVRAMASAEGAVGPAHHERLPAAPLAAALLAEVERVQREFQGDTRHSAHEVVCTRAGISERTLYAWRRGERDTVNFDAADRVLVGLDMLWFEVWDENDPAVRQVFEGEGGGTD